MFVYISPTDRWYILYCIVWGLFVAPTSYTNFFWGGELLGEKNKLSEKIFAHLQRTKIRVLKFFTCVRRTIFRWKDIDNRLKTAKILKIAIIF